MPKLDFTGKQHIYAHHLTVPYRPLVPDLAKSVNPSGVEDNLIIHGDNLYALKALLPRYAGPGRLIYGIPKSLALLLHFAKISRFNNDFIGFTEQFL